MFLYKGVWGRRNRKTVINRGSSHFDNGNRKDLSKNMLQEMREWNDDGDSVPMYLL